MRKKEFHMSKKVFTKTDEEMEKSQESRDQSFIDFNRRLLVMARQKPSIEQRITFCKITHSNLIEFLHNRRVVKSFSLSKFSSILKDFTQFVIELSDLIHDTYEELSTMIDTGTAIFTPTMMSTLDILQGESKQFYRDMRLTSPYEAYMLDLSAFAMPNDQYQERGGFPLIQAVINTPDQIHKGFESSEEYVDEIIASTDVKNAPFISKIIYEHYKETHVVVMWDSLHVWIPYEIIQLYGNYTFLNDDQSPKSYGLYTKHNYFEELLEGPMLINTPYESYDMITDFISEMCHHPNIHCIGITLYRLAEDSKIAKSLFDAIDLGKNVFIFIEVGARGNEVYNCALYKKLINCGVKTCIVENSYFSYKVHAKVFVALSDTFHIYYHNGTGNYNEKTAKLYTDLNLLGCDDYNSLASMEKISSLILHTNVVNADPVVCTDQRLRIGDMIDQAIDEGLPIYIKCNHFLDTDIAKKVLYAAESGCQVKIIARTSSPILDHPNIVIRSVIGDFLEHSRLYLFGSPSHKSFYGMIGSCDLLYRNLNKRIEHLADIDSTLLPRALDIFEESWEFDQIPTIE